MRIAEFFIFDKVFLLMIFCVLSVKGAWSVKISDFSNSSSKLTNSGIFSFFVLVLQIIFIPKAFPISATFEPILP